jgi:hypothetical protein
MGGAATGRDARLLVPEPDTDNERKKVHVFLQVSNGSRLLEGARVSADEAAEETRTCMSI